MACIFLFDQWLEFFQKRLNKENSVLGLKKWKSKNLKAKKTSTIKISRSMEIILGITTSSSDGTQ